MESISPQYGTVRPEICLLQPDTGLSPQDDHQRDRHADGLREGRAQSRTGGAHPEHSHEQAVQPDVGRAGCCNEVHGAFRVPQPPENGGDDVIGRDAGDAEEADGQIGRCPLHGLFRGGHQPHDGPHKPHKNYRQHHRPGQEKHHRVADVPCRIFGMVRTDGAADGDRGAHGHAHDHDCDHVHHLAADGHGRSADHAVELADDEQIRHAVEGLQEIGEQIRQREIRNALQYTAACQVSFHVFFRRTLSLPAAKTQAAGAADPFHRLFTVL